MEWSKCLGVCLIAFVCLSSGPTEAFRWRQPSRGSLNMYLCEGDTSPFPYQFDLSPDEDAGPTNYTFKLNSDRDGKTINESYPGPVEGIGVSRAMLKDSGTYTISILILGSRGPKVYKRRVYLHVRAAPTARGLRLSRSKDNDPQSMLLNCGQFGSLGQPPVNVLFTLPNGTVVPSTSRKRVRDQTFFSLAVPSPVQNGRYGCFIDPKSPAYRCLRNTKLRNGTYIVGGQQDRSVHKRTHYSPSHHRQP